MAKVSMLAMPTMVAQATVEVLREPDGTYTWTVSDQDGQFIVNGEELLFSQCLTFTAFALREVLQDQEIANEAATCQE